MNLLFESATLQWCKVLGAREQDTHWKRVIPEHEHEQVTAGLLGSVAMSADAWTAYWQTMTRYRNEMIAHHDLDAVVQVYPAFDPALKSANYVFDQLRVRADANSLGDIPTSLERWATRVASNMAPVVRTAFAASAQLGSNVPG